MIAGVVFALIGVTLVACKKEEIKRSTSQIQSSKYKGVSSDGKMLIFATVEDYENIINNGTSITNSHFSDFCRELNYNNYNNFHDSNDEMDKFLGTMLNKDGIIHIGKHLYKVNLTENLVYVMSENLKSSNYNNLVAQALSEDIKAYSCDEDVIYIANGEIMAKCSENSAGGRSETCNSFTIPYPSITAAVIRFDLKARYFNSGIYNNLFANMQSYLEYPTTSGLYRALYSMELRIRAQRQYKPKCRDIAPWYEFNSYGSANIEAQSYQGTRNLHKYALLSEFFYKDAGVWSRVNGCNIAGSPWHLAVRIGY